MSQRPKVLIVAYGCEPDKGSEQGVGWNWALQIARFADVTVITRANNRDSIEAAMSLRGASNPRFVYYDPPASVLRLKEQEKGLYGFYAAWQWGCYRAARRLHKDNRFSHVIQLTFGSIWLPVFAHRLPARFIWGPIGGGEGIPANLMRSVTGRARIIQLFRNALITTISFNPMIAPVLARADRILVRTKDTFDILPVYAQSKAHCLLETGVDEDALIALAPSLPRRTNDTPILLYTGRLVGFKNVEMFLHSAALAYAKGARFNIRLVGDGTERNVLELLVKQLGIMSIVTFVGALSHDKVLTELRNADIYAFPSLREGGSWSLIEAMCAALPIICLNTSGMSAITDEKSAIRINPTSRDAIIEGFADAISTLCTSPSLRDRLGQAALERVRDKFLWDRKGEQAASILFGEEMVFKALE